MSPPQSGYLLGIGSNINPVKNIGSIISLLLDHYPQLTLSRVLKIPPIGMNSQHDFLNVVVFIETNSSEADLKMICNAIEVQLGRDRNDPDRKHKDRPADLDILTKAQFPDDLDRPTNSITDEYFLYPLLEEIAAFLSGNSFSLTQTGVEITSDSLTFGQTATTINRDTGSSNKRII
ncbi:MAG: 2-amino-4-hydroxy-6-hydroxymethyldihydropteridine diphosphokinase [Gammaproteobacteria bacterium]|nr:MAG: 2-amino-4-hydroxy-6-hydroxymethyldihydropteridine diphosphokinase [Gammaproteobacteria bacterium]RKZ95730.1 MAG: 2-amino-4-hydroxy-6-hydroxymethyldihydropteridine diphosphokinase [Gammaproteobacteria bacterium]RKZ97553.1 MAG: 2-amino-4-hydroxy-6-hydroxymethyldihydropteridine diphosphokinase [Gammaproteobacteria bacterium]RLA02102.1 MAG: 2-amino-4-hydroxy-6-hydroxymethyldihydropteridine diphosphokinase [Gammaproteobacteria bacterium]